MSKIVVTYYEADAAGQREPTCLGSEIHDGVDEVLLPHASVDFPVCFVKKFSGRSGHKWFVQARQFLGPDQALEADGVYRIDLSEVPEHYDEIYLSRTLGDRGLRPNQLLDFGSLVEVDYGFVQDVGFVSGEIKSNKRYKDTLQKGEMPKRRLAVVVMTSDYSILIAPVTSKGGRNGDKSVFELTRETLSQMVRYGESGEQSWVLCKNIEAVSSRRILPPVSKYLQGKIAKSGRDCSYKLKLSAGERQSLRQALFHTVGAGEYYVLREELEHKNRMLKGLQSLQRDNDRQNIEIEKLKCEVAELELIKEVAEMWDMGQGGGQLEAEVGLLREMKTEA